MSLDAFVEKTFGAKKSAWMSKINTGGASNQKGATYENFFAISKICEILASGHQASSYTIASQERGFVDDLCVKDAITNTKTNFQAKNSNLQAADWTAEIAEKFSYQYAIDIHHYNYTHSQQVLLVSCGKKAARNAGKIPASMTYARSEHFPYHETTFDLIDKHTPLNQNLKAITGGEKLDILDYAFKLLLGAWDGKTGCRTVEEVLNDAKAMARPDIFLSSMVQRIEVPSWLKSLIANNPAFQGVSVSVESTRLKVVVNNFEASASYALMTPRPEPTVLISLTDPLQLINFVFTKAQEELN